MGNEIAEKAVAFHINFTNLKAKHLVGFEITLPASKAYLLERIYFCQPLLELGNILTSLMDESAAEKIEPVAINLLPNEVLEEQK